MKNICRKYFNTINKNIKKRCFLFTIQNNPLLLVNSIEDRSKKNSLVINEEQNGCSNKSDEFIEAPKNQESYCKSSDMDTMMSKSLKVQYQDKLLLEITTEFFSPSDYEKAVAHYNASNFDEAERICNGILHSVPHEDSYNLVAQIAHKKGEYEKSISLMKKALELNKTSSIYNNNLGNIFFEQRKFSEATEFFKKAVEYKPDFAEAHFNLGLAEIRYGNHEKALPSFQKAIQLRPDICDAYTNIGNIYMNMNKIEAAADFYRKALSLKPLDMVISVNLSLALQSLEEFEQSEKILLDALTYSPDSHELLFNLGNTYQNSENSKKAIESYKRALKIDPNNSKINYNLGTTFMESGEYTNAISCFETTLRLSPENTQAMNNIGMVLYKTGDYESTLKYYQKALSIREDFAEVHNNIGLVYKLLEDKKRSMIHFQRAVEVDPQFAEAFHNLSEIQRESQQYDEAIKNSSKAIELQPDLTPAYTNHAYLLKWLCQWDEYERIENKLDLLVKKELESGKTVGETPFMNLIRVDNPAYNRKVADYFAHNVSEKAKNLDLNLSLEKLNAKHKKNIQKKITVGYLSANFRRHPLAHLLANLFRHHNRNDFKINCYSIGPDDGSDYRKRFEEDSDIFRDMLDLNHTQSAQQIFDDKVDILIDLMGYTQGNRLEVAALRPAPIQVRYMGMPGTTGGKLFDYIIVDEIVLPRDQQINYTEKFIYMPHTYQVNDRTKKISDEPVTRKMLNLPEDSFIFCSFNTSYKIDNIVFSAWMDILRQTENSVLWLMPDTDKAGDNMHKVARQHGIDPERIIYTNNISLEKHLARIALADIALDTFAVGGAATTSDALWGGVPVITLLGNRFISRMSASILSAIGLDELVTESIDQYKQLAIRFAKNREELKQLKSKLKHNIQTMPLFDTPDFTQHLERGLKNIWDIHIAGKKSRIIDLKNR
ncbi:MAG: tetratricopeptide repeat protein [Desulfamplus sp.]|nr:tetratricopeptide repeat protein [Desulfamplus sp.]